MKTNLTSENRIISKIPENIKGLGEIALNMWWTYNPRAKNLFKSINPYLWKTSGENPIKMFKMLKREDFSALMENKKFIKEYRYVYTLFKNYINDLSFKHTKKSPYPIAYFCAEYGIHHSLPIYSGGLGFLAGDVLKEASDMNLPMVAVGFMYPHGYVRQVIGSDGWQNGMNETVVKDEAPIERVLNEKGEHLIVKVPFIEPAVYVSVWKVNVGKVELYLLDTDIEQNDPWDRAISERLYTPDMSQRLRQEIVLGVGGYRVLEELGIKYDILHLNEGHPAFALYERIRNFMTDENLSFDEAAEKVKATSVFTTHTPLQAATDIYNFDMVSGYFKNFYENLGISKEKFLSFGINPDSPQSGFNMTALAFRLCRYKNSVSKKHFEVTVNIWKNLLDSLPENDKKIDYVTNGVHLSTWLNDEYYYLYDEILGEKWPDLQDVGDLWEKIDEIDGGLLWRIHQRYKTKTIDFIRERVRSKWGDDDIDPIVALADGVLLDNDVLTLVFARRMTDYKRPYLILKDLNRLEKILNNREKPMQIIFAGKAHPADISGKKIIQEIFKVCEDRRFKGRIAFIEDYGEEVAKYLVKGADVWLNNPRIPFEACGTSGMKASMNATLHLSTPDGWWVEGFKGNNGWSFGKEPSDDEKDAAELYNLLENEIIPMYYDRNDEGWPEKWVDFMKNALKTVSPQFCARRMMKDYFEKFYSPISEELRKRE
ncbi:alpha-glucan family phosphorylase [Nautilia sp.]